MRRKLKNAGNADRPKAIWGALIGAATSIAGNIINSNAQREQASRQAAMEEAMRKKQEANNMIESINLTRNAQKAYEEQYRTSYAKGGRRKLRHGVQITDGGYAIPLGNNTFLLRGSSHQDVNETGKTGIGIKANGTEIEAENGEVLQKKGNQLRIFSNSLNDNGETPAREVLEGKNKDKVFARQQAKNGGSSPVEGMRTKAAGGLGDWLSDLFSRDRFNYNLSRLGGYWDAFKDAIDWRDSDTEYLVNLLSSLSPTETAYTADGTPIYTGAPTILPGFSNGKGVLGMLSRTTSAPRVATTYSIPRATSSVRSTIPRNRSLVPINNSRISLANTAPVGTSGRLRPLRDIVSEGLGGSPFRIPQQPIYNNYGLNILRNAARPTRLELALNNMGSRLNTLPWRNIGRYSLAGAGALGGLGLTSYFVNDAARDYFNNNNQPTSSSLVSPETNRVINSPIDTLAAPRNSVAIVNDSTLVNNSDSVLDADTIAAMSDSINSARDTISNARAAIRRMGTNTTRTSRPDSTTISNKDAVDRIRQAALQEIMDNNPNGPNNRQLNAMVANGTIETAFGDDEPVVQPAVSATTNGNRQPAASVTSNRTIAQPAATRVTTPTDNVAVGQTQDEIARDLERRFDNTPLDQIGRDATNRSASDYPYLTGNVQTPPADWNDSYYDEGPTWNRYGNYLEANREANAAANRIIASQRNLEDDRTTRSFDLGADFKPVDFANAGIGILGSVLSHAITRSGINGLEKYAPTRPALYRAGKLVTNHNINPQLTNLERARQQGYRTIDSDTSSSVTALDRKNTLGLNTALAANELYGTKYNTEAELLNKDTLNQQEVANKNVEAYNQYMNDRRNYLAGLATRRSLSNVGLIQGIGSSLSNMIQSGMDRYDNNNEIGVILSAAYPESINYIRRNNPRLARRLGIS